MKFKLFSKNSQQSYLFRISVGFVTFVSLSNLFAVNVQQFSRSNSLAYEMIEDTHLPNSFVFNDFNWIATLGLSYVEEPLVIKNSSGSSVVRPVIDNMMALHMGVGFYPYQWLMLGVTSSFNRFEDSENGNSHYGFTDPELKLKLRFLAGDRYALAVVPFVTLPTMSGKLDVTGFGKSYFLSDEGVGVGAKLVGEYLFSFAQLVASVGYRNNSEAQFGILDYRQRMDTSLGTYIPLLRTLGANIEWSRLWTFKNNQNANELYAGLSFGITQTLHGFAGVGTGNFFAKNDGNDYRVTAGVKYVPFIRKNSHEEVHVIETQKELEEYQLKGAVADTEVSACVNPYVLGSTNVATLRFPNNFHDLNISKLEGLDRVIEIIQARLKDIQSVSIIGHTSAVGNEAYNQKLSQLRAQAVQSYMQKKGIPAELLRSEGKGESNLLIKPELSREDQEKNRRTEILIQLKENLDLCGK